VTTRGQIKMMDFGLAKLAAAPTQQSADSEGPTVVLENTLTNPGSTIGTAAYMSPEQARGMELDARTDLFSFGVVLYEMATAAMPFRGSTPALTFVAILQEPPVPPTRLRPDLPHELERIVLTALEKDRDLRYQTAAEIRADLKRVRRDSDSSRSMPRAVAGNQTATYLNPVSGAANESALSGAASPAAPSMASPPSRTTAGPVAAQAAAPSTSPSAAAPSPSSSEYIAQAVKSHKRAAFAILAALGVVALLAAFWLFREKPIDSLAVLPFDNMGGDPSTEYLSDGITESIINTLSQLPKLSVRSFSSVQHLKKRSIGPDEAGRQLKVRAVLTGRLVKRGDGFAVSAELIDVDQNRQIWGSQYTPRATDLQTIQEQISRDISDKLRIQLTGKELARMARQSTTDTVAYQLYLQGRFQWNKRTLEGMQDSIDYFQQAIDKDPQYALAYAGQADAYALLADFSVLPAREVLPKLENAARKAIELDDGLAEAHTSLAWARFHNWDWTAAEKEFKRAIELNASYPTAHAWYGEYLMVLGRFDDAQREMQTALDLNPVSPVLKLALGSRYYYARQFPQALEQIQKTLAAEPGFVPAHVYLGRAWQQTGKYPEAIAEFQKALEASQGDTNELAYLGQGYAAAKQEADARKVLAQLNERSAQTYVQPIAIALIQALLGAKDEAFDYLRKAYEDRSTGLVYLKVDPAWDGIRSDSRFVDILGRVGLK
jgi:TolB-like protein/Tfp pilus assembly protein PilF